MVAFGSGPAGRTEATASSWKRNSIPVWMVRSKGRLWEGARDMDIRELPRGERLKKVGSRASRQPTIKPLPRCLCLLRSKLGDHGVAEAQLNLKQVTSPPSRPNLDDDFIFYRAPCHRPLSIQTTPSWLANKNSLVNFPSFKVACGCYLVSCFSSSSIFKWSCMRSTCLYQTYQWFGHLYGSGIWSGVNRWTSINKHVFIKYWIVCSKHANHSKLNSQQALGDLHNHSMSTRTFTLMINKIFIHVPEIRRQWLQIRFGFANWICVEELVLHYHVLWRINQSNWTSLWVRYGHQKVHMCWLSTHT